MNESMLDRLKTMENRYEELGHMLMDPDIGSDIKKMTEVTKEQSSLQAAYDLYQEYKEVEAGISDAKELAKESDPEIYELVEELCLAGGLPVPKIYITPDPDPNAFATGRDPEHASLALTQGLLSMMNKKEVQGVIGHELSHIRNYDTRITVLASALTSLITITGIGIVLFGWGVLTSESKGWLGLIIKFFAMFLIIVGGIISIIGIPLAKLLFLLVSRQREYLADIGSVDLTREPSGLISALSKLEKMEESESTPEINSQDLALEHLYFNLPHPGNWIDRLFSDHPPLDKRIERLKNSDKIE